MEPAGAQRMASAVFEQLETRGHQAEWWSLYLKRPAYETWPGVHCLSDTPPKSPLDYTQIVTRFVRRLYEFHPDVIFAFTHYANTIGLAGGCLVRVPVRIASQQNIRDSYPWAARIADSVLGTIGAYSVNVMCSRAVHDSFSRNPQRYRADTTLIPNGCKLGDDAPTADERAAAKKALGLDPARKLVVAVGRLTAQKRHHVLIDGMQHLPGCDLWIAGEGEDRGVLEARIAAAGSRDRIRLIGNVSPADVSQLLAAADAFAMASEFEGLSLALVEAMAAGLPIVASDIPPIREVLVDDIGMPAGILIKSTDSTEWAAAIGRLIDSRELNESYSRRAQRRAQSFDIDRSAYEYVAIAEARLDMN
jgi:glycosyltransferase involved in cell wall biosynthesis